jgi:TatA/E family protein of Tat protein translocase
MEIFGIGPMELLLILIIALMIFGPDKLPEIGAKLGHALRDMRQATRQFSQEIEETRRAIEEPIQEARETGEEAVKPFQDAAETAATIGQALTHPGELVRDSVMRNLEMGGQEETVSTATEAGPAKLPAVEGAPAAEAASEAPAGAPPAEEAGTGSVTVAVPDEPLSYVPPPESVPEAPVGPLPATEEPMAIIGAPKE